jgi:hypothetical protein
MISHHELVSTSLLLFLSSMVLFNTSCTPGKFNDTNSSSTILEEISTPTSPVLDAPSSNPLKVAVSSVGIYAGETHRISVTGGKKPYQLSDSGTGNLDSLTYNYKASTNLNPITDIINIIDSLGTKLTVTIKVRGFDSGISSRSQITHNLASSNVNKYYIAPDNTHFIASRVTVNSVSRGSLFRSTDNGLTFSSIYGSVNSGEVNWIEKLANGKLVMIVKDLNSSGILSVLIKSSADNGNSWTTIAELENADYNNAFIGQVTGALYLMSDGRNEWDTRIIKIFRSLDYGVTWSLFTTFDYSSLTTDVMPTVNGLVEVNTNTVFLANTVDTYYSSSFNSKWLIVKTTDGGNSWTTVDDFVLTAGKDNIVSDLIKLPNGTLLALGQSNVTTYNSIVIRKSTDNGSTWTTSNTYNYAAGKSCYSASIITNQSGIIYQKMMCLDASNNYHLLTRSTTDGNTWVMESDVYNTGAYSISYGKLQFDNTGNLFGIDIYNYQLISFYTRSVFNIQMKPASGSFANLSTYSYLSKSLTPTSGYFNNDGKIIVVGSAQSTTYNVSNWLTHFSVDDGANWVISDNYIYPGSTSLHSSAKDILKTSSGDLLVIGSAAETLSYNRWIVRKGQASGTGNFNWSTIDNFHPLATSIENPLAIFQSSSGRVFVSGTSTQDGNTNWIVRRSSADLSSWSTVDNYQATNLTYNYPNQIFQDSAGRIFVNGRSDGDYSVTPNSKLRISDDDGVTWSTIRSWGSYDYNYMGLLKDDSIINIGIKAKVIYLEISKDRGQTWTLLNQKTFSVQPTINSIKGENDNVFIFGSFKTSEGYSTVFRYNLTNSAFYELDRTATMINGTGIKSFNCYTTTWCLLNSAPGPLAGETMGLIRKMSQ